MADSRQVRSRTLDASILPEKVSFGTCSSSLLVNTSCTPICEDGFRLSAELLVPSLMISFAYLVPDVLTVSMR